MASRGMPPDQPSTHHDGVSSEQATYRRATGRTVRDDRYPALLPGVDKPPSTASNTRNSFISDDVEKLYDFTATAAVATDAGRRGVACQAVSDYAPAVERASSTVDVGRALALFGADRLYQSATATLACPLCVHPGSTAWTREALYVERRPVTRHEHDADCPLHAAEKLSFDVARWQEQQQTEMAVYPPGLRSPDQLMLGDDCQHDHNASRSQ